MWGFVRLLDKHEFDLRPKEEAGIPPLVPGLPSNDSTKCSKPTRKNRPRGIKGFLVATGYAVPDPINGLGNAIAQDILFKANLSPKRKIDQLSAEERSKLYNAIQDTVAEAIKLGGRYDEVDLYAQPGRYMRLMDSKT